MRERSTGDILVLMFAGTVCLAMLASGLAIFIIRIVHPETNVDAAAALLGSFLQTLLGLTAGFLAGRTGNRAASRRDNE